MDNNNIDVFLPLRNVWLICILLIMCCHTRCLAQSCVKGYVKSSDGVAIANSNVCVLSVSDSLIDETHSDSLGYYLLENLRPGSYIVKAGAEDYKESRKRIMLFKDKTMMVDMTLVSSVIQLDEVNVNGTGIIASGDTIKYITSHFTTGQEQTLGDVLETLPGVKVDKDNSSVTVNGKTASRILLEKQDLFQGNNSIPLNNIPGQDVTSIDVIDHYSDYNILEGFKTSDETVISVNMNGKKKNVVSGQADVQYGVCNKYIMKDYTMMLRKKLMLSAIVSANNTGKALLTSKDIIGMNGGYRELLSGDDPIGKMKKTLSENSSLIGNREDAYKRNNGVLSLNTVIMPSGKVKILWNVLVGLDSYNMNTTTQYSYLNIPLQYDVRSSSKNNSCNVSSNMKVSLMPSESFNIFYTGRIAWIQSDNDNNGYLKGCFTNNTASRNFDQENTLIAIKKIGDKNTLNFGATYSYLHNNRDYDFSADSTFYYGYRSLDDSYNYNNRAVTQDGGAECFVLCRLNDYYYTRIGIRSNINQESLMTRLIQNSAIPDFDNDDYIRYYDNSFDLQLRKDRGDLQFAVKTKVAHMRFETNVSHCSGNTNHLVVTPSLDLTYSLGNMHNIMFTYKDVVNPYGIRNIFSNVFLDSYRQFHTSGVNSMFGYNHNANLIHSLVRPLSGFTLVNTLSYTYSADDAVNNNLLNSIVREARYTTTSSIRSFLASSLVQKKFITFPLDMTANISYSHSYSPYYMNDDIIQSKSNMYDVYGSISTFRKKGLNAKTTAHYTYTDMYGDYKKYSVKNLNVSALLSYTFSKLYTEVKCRYRTVSMAENRTDNIYFDLTARYNLSNAVILNVTGRDVMHVSSKTSSDATINNYYTAYSTTMYMPGYIIFGLSIKY